MWFTGENVISLIRPTIQSRHRNLLNGVLYLHFFIVINLDLCLVKIDH